MNKDTVIISAFPGTGKSYIKNNNRGGNVILDSDSNLFSWLYNKDGSLVSPRTRNPDFPNNYIKHIKDNIGIADIIFISSHDIVRDALKKNNIKFITVYPHIDLMDEYIRRYRLRGNDESFTDFMQLNWSHFITEMHNDNLCYQLNAGEYISSVLEDIIIAYRSH